MYKGDATAHEEEEAEETADKDKGASTTDVDADAVADDAATAAAGDTAMASAFHHWRATTSPVASPTKTKGSGTQEDQGQAMSTTVSAPSSGPPSRRASIEKVVDDVLAKAIEAVVTKVHHNPNHFISSLV